LDILVIKLFGRIGYGCHHELNAKFWFHFNGYFVLILRLNFWAFWGLKFAPHLSWTVRQGGADHPAMGARTVRPPSVDRPPSGRAPYRSCSHFPGYHLIIIGILHILFQWIWWSEEKASRTFFVQTSPCR
jgi:hypothetical protein